MIRIAQVGTFDVDNLGDLLFPVIFNNLVADVAGELQIPIECTFFSPQGIGAGRFYRDQPASLALEHFESIDNASPFDLIFVGGGDIIRDDDDALAPIYGPHASPAGFSHLSSPTQTASRRLVLLMPGVPFALSPAFKNFLENSFRRLRFAAVRDRFSAQRLGGLVPADVKLEVLPDIAAATAHYYPRAQLPAFEDFALAADLRRDGFICFQAQANLCADVESTGQALRRLEHKTGLSVVLLEIGRCQGDDRFLSQLAQRFSFTLARPPTAAGSGSLMQKVAVIAAARGFIGTSLHGVILAHAYGVPHFCFSGNALSKVRGFYETCASGRSFADFAECFVKLDAVSEGIGGPAGRATQAAGALAPAQDHVQIRKFVRAAVESVAKRGAQTSGFNRQTDSNYRQMQAARQQCGEWGAAPGAGSRGEGRGADVLAIQDSHVDFSPFFSRALEAKFPWLHLVVRRTFKFIWWGITFQLPEKYRERRLRLIANAHTRSPHDDHALAMPFSWAPVAVGPLPSLAVICHMYFADLAAEFRGYLSNIPFRFDLYITTDTNEKKLNIESVFSDWPRGAVEVRLAKNRGRDIAPKLIVCADVYREYEYVLHIHTKRSPHGFHLAGWRTYLLETLLGSPEIVLSVFEIFRSLPGIGLIAPQHLESVRSAVGWGFNYADAGTFLHRLGLQPDMDGMMDFPSGSMFWARSAALLPILDVGLSFEDFALEKGQQDGTLAHVIERLYFFICEAAGYDWIKIARPELLRDTSHRTIVVNTAAELVQFSTKHRVRLLGEREHGVRARLP